MPHPAPAHKSFADRNSLYQKITGKIIAELQQGRVPWVQPWGNVTAPLGLPKNATTGRAYTGVNVLILWIACMERGFGTQSWLTFRQALKAGGHVRKGEKGTTIVYADRFIPYRERMRAAETGNTPDAIPFLKSFTVFNSDQCEDLPADLAPRPPSLAQHDDLVLPEAEALIRATGADLRIGGNRAFYVPSEDFIQVPPPSSYFEPINWHRTVCHELGHWTGAEHRLNRDMSVDFGSASYGREELIAEIAGAFVCAALGIVPTVRHADYIGSWLEVLHEDNRAIIRAASAASKAADYLLAFRDRDDEALVEGPAVPAIQRPTPELSMAAEVQP
jgi:antirestriction protein ArdC